MKKNLLLFLMLITSAAFAQLPVIKTGDTFPDMVIRPVVNAPSPKINIKNLNGAKLYILNFWGTWCSPCIPEMDALAKLQKANMRTLQVIAISDDSPARLKKYLATKPSAIWLASDTGVFLYRAFGLSSVGQSAIVNSKHQVVALVKTHAINQQMINALLAGKKIRSDAETKELPVSNIKDAFGVDSTMTESVTLRGYMKGERSRGFHSPLSRRVSYYNVCSDILYKDAFAINSPKQIRYELDEKEACDFNNKASLYCFDLLVKPEEADSLYSIMQKKLLALLPIKAKIIEQMMPVYVLKKSFAEFKPKLSQSKIPSPAFSGRGFDGTGVTFGMFADKYLNNELDRPVVDETGLDGRYDIKTTVDIRTLDNIVKSVTDLGLSLEKAERKMKVLVFYK
ncbi:redoxin domain-containing protein [Mucilaginibacter calamicampi]|uniref:Redoxin domain-containing protein n=1 Tax=Mucilaginibacter calamicampi TaxID=1302352 RepID=A0ABW2Z060_9SPHI